MIFDKAHRRLDKVEERLASLDRILDGIADRIQAIVRAQDATRESEVSASELRELEIAMGRELEEFGRKIDHLSQAVVEGISNVERRENRIRASIGRARKELQEHGLEHPGVEAEYRELQVLNGSRSEQIELPEVRENVADVGNRFAAFPGSFDGSFQDVG